MIELPQGDNSPSLLPDMTALLDVIFILLIFMMLTANVAPHALELDLPKLAAPAIALEANNLTVGISEQGVFSIDGQRHLDWQDFQLALQDQIQQRQQLRGSAPQLLVAADKDVALHNFVKLAGWLSEKGQSVAELVVSEQ